MGVVDHGRSLNRYNLGQRRKKGFLTDSNRMIQQDRRIGRKAKPPNKPPRPDGLQLTKSRKKKIFRMGIPILLGLLFSVLMTTLWAMWFLGY